MIFSSIYARDDTSKYPAALQRAIEYLRSNDFLKMEPGVYEIDGKRMYAQVFDALTGPFEEKRPEFHKKYIDVQFLCSGIEKLGYAPDCGGYALAEAIEERDLYFVESVDNESFLTAVPGCYSIFFPNDIHRPAISVQEPTKIRKVVLKVSMELL